MSEQVGRTPREGLQELRRRERISELRAAHRRIGRHGGYWKMLVAAIISNQVLAWTLMIMTGIAHGSWWRTVPTMSYHAASLLTGFAILGVAVTVITIQTARDSS